MATGRLNPVAWTEGMFLRPQHFQQHDLYLEERLRYHLSTLSPFHWGVRNLSVNEDQLTANVFEIQQFEAVLPSGAIVRTGDNAVVEPRAFDPSNERTAVYIGLRSVSDSESGMTAEQGEGEHVRYQIKGRDLPDRTRVGAVAPVDLAFPKLHLLFSGEEKELEVYEHFKLAEIVATGEKRRFELAHDYCPPLLVVQAFPPLQDRIARIVAQLKAKLIVVAGRTSGTLAVAELPRYWMRYTLARISPMIEHLLSTGSTNPFALYTTLVDAAGALAAFNLSEPAQFPLYDHDDLMRCFTELAEFLDEQLGEAVPDRFTRLDIPFVEDKKLYHSAALNTDTVSPHNHYYLAIKAELEVQDLVERVTRDAKAGALSTVKLGLRANLAGVPIEHLPAPPTEVELLAGYQYFSLDPHHAKWKKVQEDFDFALSLPNVESADVRLYVVKGDG